MSLQENVMDALKEAMKSKDKVALEALRAIKSALLVAQTSGIQKDIDLAEELAILQRLVKQRKESATIYLQQNRSDLAEPELAQADIISKFLPSQALKVAIADIIKQTEANSIKDMGKVMGIASKQFAGKADGKAIATLVKQLLG